jgi:molecular chaperone GrpE
MVEPPAREPDEDETMTDSVSKPEAMGPSNGPSEEDEIVTEQALDEDEIVVEDVRGEDEIVAEDAPEGGIDGPFVGEEAIGEAPGGGRAADAVEEAGTADAELARLREEFEGLRDRHLRLAAEFNNYRRRVEAERLDLWARAQADLVGRFLDVLDDLQRVAGLDLDNATVEAIMEGIDLVDRKFLRVLQEVGAEVIDPVGEPFDPETMEAMMRVPAEKEEDDDVVDQVFLKGYGLKGQLVRPARVSVRKHG